MKNKILLLAVACIVICTIAQSQNVFPDSGFVGIGTDDPEAPLELGDAYDYMIFSGSTIFGKIPGTENITFGSFTFVESIADESYGNIAFGNSSQRNNTTGELNISFGSASLTKNTTGSHNIAIGQSAAYYLTVGDYNIALGPYSLYGNNGTFSQFANENIALGHKSLYTNGLGNENIALGTNTMFNNLKGNYNTALGCYSLDNNIKGNYNTALGYSADAAGVGYTNATVIGYNALVDASNKVRIGNASVTSNGGQVSWTAYSDARIKNTIQQNVPGLEFINLLKPVTYHFDVDKQNAIAGVQIKEEVEGMYDIEKIQFTGFIAQDVEAAAQQINYDFSGVDKSGEIMGLRYSEFVVPLVKAVQELDTKNEELRMENVELKMQNEQLQKQVSESKKIETDFEKRIAKLEKKQAKSNTNNQEETAVQQIKLSADNTVASLSQNIPNPFSGKTEIHYFVPESATSAYIKIANANGASLFTADIKLGKGILEIDASQLAAGTYSYTLIVDGKVIDTKLMVMQQ